ncbi:hypothetical protein N197_07840 [Helicobacter pylori UM023]|nr:hypothetical protein N197_07840 [Helicobacter pylori UM023]
MGVLRAILALKITAKKSLFANKKGVSNSQRP